jgi:hypothetical protein
VPGFGCAITSDGKPRALARSAWSLGAAAAADPTMSVVLVLPDALRLAVWHPLAP